MDHMKAEMSVLLDFRGVRVRRVLDPSRAVVAEHARDWPMISLYVMGGYRNVTDCGEREIAGPSMVFYRPGAGHRNVAGETGFEQIEIEFDPAWLGASALPPQAVLTRVGGTCGALARSLCSATPDSRKQSCGTPFGACSALRVSNLHGLSTPGSTA